MIVGDLAKIKGHAEIQGTCTDFGKSVHVPNFWQYVPDFMKLK